MDLGQNAKSKTRSHRTSSSTTTSDGAAKVSPVTRTAVSLEFASLRYKGHCPLGMYIVPSENILIWDAVFFVHQGYYADSILKLRLTFPVNYPDRPPVVKFLSDVFHPLISQQTGVLNLSPRFRPWRPKEHSTFEILHWIKAAFKKQALDEIKEPDCYNKEAYRLYHETTSSFAALANQSSMLSQSFSALFDGDHPTRTGKSQEGMPFSDLQEEQLAAVRSNLDLREWDDELI